jgi:hypothetical protein
MSEDLAGLRAALVKWKYPILILLAGLMLLLLPAAEKKQEPGAESAQEALAQILSRTQGVGEACVLISDSGVVVACGGASNAAVRLDIIRAVGSYTGFGSDKITILKLCN